MMVLPLEEEHERTNDENENGETMTRQTSSPKRCREHDDDDVQRAVSCSSPCCAQNEENVFTSFSLTDDFEYN